MGTGAARQVIPSGSLTVLAKSEAEALPRSPEANFHLVRKPFPQGKSTYSPVVALQNCVEFIIGHILIWKCYDNGRDIEVKSVGYHNFGKDIISNL